MHIFHTTSGFKKPNISRNTRWNCNFSLPFRNLPLQLHVIQTKLPKLGRNSLCQILNISYFSHFTSNISGQKMYGSWSCSDLENLHFWFDKETAMYRQFYFQKTIELYCDLWKLFYTKWTEQKVEIQLIWFWLANILCLLSDYRKEEIIYGQ